MREHLESAEDNQLAPYAMRSSRTRGREHSISPDPYRTDFQRDRDRIIHSAAFRKLEYKTQVYVIHEGDYFRTRLTHSLEVAQIARTLARTLALNTDLTEAIALSHDLGHTPFGHSGEAALQKLLAASGGFEHNLQSLRVVEKLEERYHEFPGLNLTWEVREGIAKHSTAYDSPHCDERFDPDLMPTVEAQICDLADEIAYNHHDVDDALKMGLITTHQLRDVKWVWEIWDDEQNHLKTDVRPKYVIYRMIGRMMEATIEDVLRYTSETIERNGIKSVEDVRRFKGRLADFSPDMKRKHDALKAFLMKNVYYHPHVVRMQSKAERFVTSLFELYRKTPLQLPLKYQARIETEGLDRVITDYISGMTDRYCMEEYIKAFEPTLGPAR
ncbi:deoxyguanosinetriphosphate triphosphohydrolase [Candidatus Sumerlaeota bacterium]|nr:deoxyguanosinetriphosphate triphosphohydrolase [Candidatus Sumerlaeota bacterium]